MDPLNLPLRFRIVLGLIGIALLGSTSFVFVQYGLGAFDGSTELNAVFPQSSQGLDTSSDVKMLGVTVGTVKSINLQPDGKAVVKLKLRAGVKVADSVAASIEPLSVFGPKYIKLEPGDHATSGPFLVEDDTITKTSNAVEFQDILNQAETLLSKIEVADLVTIFKTFADSIAGLGPQFSRIVDNAGVLLDIGVKHIPDWQQFLSDLASISGAFADSTETIASTIGNLNQVLPEIAGRGDQLTAALDGASKIAGQLNGYITENREEFGSFVNSAATVLKVAYDQVPDFPNLFIMLDEFFGTLSDVIRLPGPNGERIGALHGGLFDLVCANLQLSVVPGLCEPEP